MEDTVEDTIAKPVDVPASQPAQEVTKSQDFTMLELMEIVREKTIGETQELSGHAALPDCPRCAVNFACVGIPPSLAQATPVRAGHKSDDEGMGSPSSLSNGFSSDRAFQRDVSDSWRWKGRRVIKSNPDMAQRHEPGLKPDLRGYPMAPCWTVCTIRVSA